MVTVQKTVTVSSVGNYTATTTKQIVEKIVSNPSALKKTFQFAIKTIQMIDLQVLGKLQDRHATKAMTGSIELLEFYGTFQNFMFFINPFSKDTLDKKALSDSLVKTMCSPVPQGDLRDKNEATALEVVEDVMGASAFHSAEQVRHALIQKLVSKGIADQDAVEIAAKSTIKQKDRPLTLLFSKACFTTVDLVGNLMTLQKWGLVNLSAIVAQIGNQSPVLAFVINFGAGKVLGVIASAGLIVTFSEATYRAVRHAMDHFNAARPEDKKMALKELQIALVDMLSSGTDLVNAAAPLLFALNPPVLTGLAIYAKGTGLVCIFLKEKLLKEKEELLKAA